MSVAALRKIVPFILAGVSSIGGARMACVLRLLLMLASITPTAAALASPRSVTFGGDLDYPPYEWSDNGEVKGFLIDLEAALARAGNARAVHKLDYWPITVASLQNGTVDIVPMFRSADREKRFWFSRPLTFSHHAIFTRTDPGRVTSIAQLVRWRVTVERSSFAHHELARTIPARNLVLAGNTEEALRALLEGRADYAVLSEVPALRLSSAMQEPIRRVGAPLWPRAYALAVRKDHVKTIAWTQQALAAVMASGEFNRLQAKWQPQLEPMPDRFGTEQEDWAMPLVLLVFLALGLVLGYLRQAHVWQKKPARTPNTMSPASGVGISTLSRDFIRFGKDEIFACFQPQLDLHTGKVKSAEALLRWNHPRMGPIAPDRLIPELEYAGLVGEVTIRMMEQAVTESVRFREHGLPIRFSVNVSALDFVQLNLPELVASMLAKLGGRGEDLMIELTESGAVSDLQLVADVIARLKLLGVSSALDDFGTGFASLATFTEIRFDELKIDRLFVERMLTSRGHKEAVSSAIKMARRMDMEVVAEGAPDLATIDLLRKLKCDRVQSYAVAPPVSASELQTFVSGFLLKEHNFGSGGPNLKLA